MHKAELINAIAEKTGETKKTVEAIVNAQMDVISEELTSGEEKKVTLIGFGTFETTERAARKGRNPQTGKEINIPASKAVKFKAGKALKDKVNK